MVSAVSNTLKLLTWPARLGAPSPGLVRTALCRGAMRGLPILLLLISSPAAAGAEDESYRLNPGDELLISVWKESDLQREVLVLPDGSVGFPLAGQVRAEGLTPNELELYRTLRVRYEDPGAGSFEDKTCLEVILRNIKVRQGVGLKPEETTSRVIELERKGKSAE